MIYTVRPVVAALLLGVTLLSACDSGDPQPLDASPSSSSTAAVRWQRLAAECPEFAGAAARFRGSRRGNGREDGPGRQRRRAHQTQKLS